MEKGDEEFEKSLKEKKMKKPKKSPKDCVSLDIYRKEETNELIMGQ